MKAFFDAIRPLFGGQLLFNMRPSLIVDDQPNKGPADAKLGCNSFLRHAANGQSFNFRNMYFQQFSRVALAKRMSATINHVARILLFSSYFKMRGIAARWVVALMPNAQTDRHARAVGCLPSNDMGIFEPITATAYTYLAVPSGVPPSRPLPTIFGQANFNFSPKAIRDGPHLDAISFSFRVHAVA